MSPRPYWKGYLKCSGRRFHGCDLTRCLPSHGRSSRSSPSANKCSQTSMPDDERRRALELLNSAGDQGMPEELMVNAFVFEFDVIIGLIRDGLATTAVEKTRVGHSTVRVMRMRITEAGRKALAEGV